MSNKVYDILKYTAMIFIPALASLLGTAGLVLGWTNTDIIVTITVAVGTFIGALVGKSAINYNGE